MTIKAYRIKKGDKIDGLEVVGVDNVGGTIEVILRGGTPVYYDFADDVEVERN